ncbi:MAG: MlaD family protein [Fuerstiella sp.]|jgi:phospholipid/cholesterol/gamma-HCH transport system substrate-binding protein|nr:MlaD family protein [Fuerstiella sp.]
MDERQQEFRVGIMVVVALAAAVVMVFKFGELGNRWKSGTRIDIVLPSASGIFPETPVRMSGIRIGQVQSMALVAEGRGVVVHVLIESDHTFRNDSSAQITRSLLGDGAIEITPGDKGEAIKNGDRIVGRTATDPTEIVARVEQRLASTLVSFERTGQQWGTLANNLNRVLEASGPDGINTIQRSAIALEQFTRTMKSAEDTLTAAGSLIGDPRYQQQLQQTLSALPELLTETRGTLRSVNSVIRQVDSTMENINTATAPLARDSQTMVTRLNQSLGNIEAMTGELAVVARLASRHDGTVKKLLTDPSVYRNLNSTAASLAVLLENLKPVVSDLQIFSDKVARHPELLGVRGIVRGSTGIKDSGVVPAAFEDDKR